MSISTEKYVLLTGSDLGNRESNLALALELIQKRLDQQCRTSEIMETEPWGFNSETRFLNQAILITTELAPEQLLKEILKIEVEIGRVREKTQWVSRMIDIDILCAENLIHHTVNLVIPHVQLHHRSFALNPLCQLAGHWNHPHFGKTYAQLNTEVNQSIVSNSRIA
tara:strand:- start:189 stop:689 length:501 start_codon:yes stop_codon:yes gene_type:complete